MEKTAGLSHLRQYGKGKQGSEVTGPFPNMRQDYRVTGYFLCNVSLLKIGVNNL